MEAQHTTSRQDATECGQATRQCPTVVGKTTALITHMIEPQLCLKRQREYYHKCHRCAYRGKAADFVAQEQAVDIPTPPPHRNGNGTA